MPYSTQVGDVPRMRFSRFEKPDGSLYAAEVMGEDGFSSDMFGCNYPFVLNVRDFSPITGSFHRPPPAAQAFEATNMVFCNFVPRMLDYDPRAMPIPSFHSNVDSEEVLFFVEGSFGTRKGGIARGGLSIHPSGHTHGPHPSALKTAGWDTAHGSKFSWFFL